MKLSPPSLSRFCRGRVEAQKSRERNGRSKLSERFEDSQSCGCKAVVSSTERSSSTERDVGRSGKQQNETGHRMQPGRKQNEDEGRIEWERNSSAQAS